MYRHMLITRAVEERGHILYRQGKIPGSFYTGRGNEGAAVGVATAMGTDDVGTPLHRDMGVHIVRGVEPWRIFAQYMGRRDGPTHGKDGNVHMADANLGLIAMVSHLPAMLPVAVGCALAFRIREEKRVALAWFGEGAAARGDAHEGMNFAGVRKLPGRVHLRQQPVGVLDADAPRLRDRARRRSRAGVRLRRDRRRRHRRPRGLPRGEARDREGARRRRPDADRVRDAAHGGPRRPRRRVLRPASEMLEEWAKADPIERFRTWLRENADFTDDEEDEIQAGVKKLLNDALQRAEESPLPDPSELTRRRVRDARRPRHAAPQVMAEKTYLQAISDGLREEMRRDKRVFLIGEDVGVYGGAFKVSLGFQEEFGPWRVIDAPLSETAIVAGCTGAAIMGMRPVAEMQFADFISCAWDHLVTVAAKQRWRAGHAGPDHGAPAVGRRLLRRAVPLAEPGVVVRAHPGPQVRLPRDAGGREGPARERDRGSEPGPLLRAQAPLPADQGRGARRALHGADRQGAHAPRGRGHLGDHLGRDGLHGGRGRAATRGRRRLGRDRRPAHGDAVGQEGRARSARKTSKVLVLHEDTRTGGFGAEIAATIAEEAFEDLDAPVKRITAPDTPVPFSPPLEKAFIPQVEDVVAGLQGARRVLMATTSVVDVVMPQMGVSVSEGTITKWLKQVGDTVEADESLLEISTDKVDTEVPSPGTGVVQEILVQEGETVEVGTKLATIAPEGAEVAAPAEPEASAAGARDRRRRRARPRPRRRRRLPRRPGRSRRARSAAADGSTDGRTFVSPVVAKIASEHGVDPSRVAGTGRGGRVTKKDILAFIESGAPATAPPTPEPAPSPDPVPQPAPEPAPPAPTPPPQPERPAAGRRDARARDRDAARDRRAHAPLARHRRARDERDRGRHVEGGRRSARS